MEKFIYVFSERDKNLLLGHGYVLAKEPKKKRATRSKKNADVPVENINEDPKVWIFFNKMTKDMILDDLESYVFSNVITF